jgi:hypothetical protein
LHEVFLAGWLKDRNDAAKRPEKDVASGKAYQRKLP